MPRYNRKKTMKRRVSRKKTQRRRRVHRGGFAALSEAFQVRGMPQTEGFGFAPPKTFTAPPPPPPPAPKMSDLDKLTVQGNLMKMGTIKDASATPAQISQLKDLAKQAAKVIDSPYDQSNLNKAMASTKPSEIIQLIGKLLNNRE